MAVMGRCGATLDDTATMTEVAETVHLSPERFSHLFPAQTGVRFRPYALCLYVSLIVALGRRILDVEGPSLMLASVISSMNTTLTN
jgi:hypothetical protein